MNTFAFNPQAYTYLCKRESSSFNSQEGVVLNGIELDGMQKKEARAKK